MNIKNFLIKSYSKKIGYGFVLWSMAAYFVFFTSSLSLYIFEKDTQEAQLYQQSKKRLHAQFQKIESLLALIDKRLLHTTSDKAQQKVLQDRYSTIIAGESYPKIQSIYHIQNIGNGAALNAYGKIILDQLPPPSFFEELQDSTKKIAITVDKQYIHFFCSRTVGDVKNAPASFLMLKIPLEEFFLTGVFGLHLFRTKEQMKEDILMTYKKELSFLQERSQDQTEEILLFQDDIKMHEQHLEALTSSSKIQEHLKKTHGQQQSPVKERLEKKLNILVEDLTQLTAFDPSLESLLEMSQTAQEDFQNLLLNNLSSYQNNALLLEELITTSMQGLSNIIFCKNITYEITIDPEVSRIWGDEIALQILTMNIFHKSMERLKVGGKIKIKAAPTTRLTNMLHLEIWDNGYNFDDSKLLQYAALNQHEHDIFSLGWECLEKLIMLYGGEVHQKTYSVHGNTVSIYLPRSKEAIRVMNQEDNVIPFVKSQALRLDLNSSTTT